MEPLDSGDSANSAAMVYAAAAMSAQAVSRVEALALRVLAERIESKAKTRR